MAIKSELYAVNSTLQNLGDGGTVNFGNVVHRFGCNTDLRSGNAVVYGKGYYNIDASIDFEPSGAGTVVISLYKDGTVIPGSTVTSTVIADTMYSVSVPSCVIRQTCCCDGVITAQISGVATTVSNATIRLMAV